MLGHISAHQAFGFKKYFSETLKVTSTLWSKPIKDIKVELLVASNNKSGYSLRWWEYIKKNIDKSRFGPILTIIISQNRSLKALQYSPEVQNWWLEISGTLHTAGYLPFHKQEAADCFNECENNINKSSYFDYGIVLKNLHKQ